jgi:hypothetical protein
MNPFPCFLLLNSAFSLFCFCQKEDLLFSRRYINTMALLQCKKMDPSKKPSLQRSVTVFPLPFVLSKHYSTLYTKLPRTCSYAVILLRVHRQKNEFPIKILESIRPSPAGIFTLNFVAADFERIARNPPVYLALIQWAWVRFV